MAKRRPIQGHYEKLFCETFYKLSERHNAWSVWCDFVKLFACCLSNGFEVDPVKRDAREKIYLDIAKTYTPEELNIIGELASITVQALDHNARQDFLGSLYMSLDFGDLWRGQFFTPWNIAYCMAMITVGNCEKEMSEKGFCSIYDCACGAGCMLIAAAAAYRYGNPEQQRNYQTDIVFAGQDIDPIVALMCYIQLSLLGCAGYVVIGDTLKYPICGYELDPYVSEDCEIWFTPMWYSPLWQSQRLLSRLRRQNGAAG